MGKKIPDAVMDVALADIADTGDVLHLCTDEPANYAGIAAVSCGSVALTEGDGNGSYTIGNGSTSGRQLTLAAQTVTATASGDVDHLVIADSVAEVIKAVTTCGVLSVTNTEEYSIDSYAVWEIRDPS